MLKELLGHESLSTTEIYTHLSQAELKEATDSNPLAKIKDSGKLIITPHMAWGSVEARQRVVDGVYKNIEAYLNGEKRNVVNQV